MHENKQENMEQIYLAGSFTGFRDQVINSLNKYNIWDARKNPQYAMFATNDSDLAAARYSSVMGVCFPKKHNPGVMTFVEMGQSYSARNSIIVADEIQFEDLALEIADEYFTSIENEFIPYLQQLTIPKQKNEERPKEHRGAVENILTYDLPVKHNKKIIKNNNPNEELYMHKEGLIDLVVVGFHRGKKHNRRAAFSMGMAEYFKVPVIVYTDRKVPYPPLTGGLQRRLFTDKKAIEEYINRIETNDIAVEAKLMYELFEKYDGEM